MMIVHHQKHVNVPSVIEHDIIRPFELIGDFATADSRAGCSGGLGGEIIRSGMDDHGLP